MKLWKAILCVLIVSLLVSMAIPVVSAPKPPGGGGKPPKDEPPADPAIAYFFQTSGPNPDRLMVMNDDGSNQAVIYEEYFSPISISWSPDGKSIAWSAWIGWTTGVWRIDVEVIDGVPQGSDLTHLVSSDDVGGYIGGAAWSPLGGEIAYRVQTITDTYRIDAVPATGGNPYNIYTAPEGYGLTNGVAWSSDGTRLAAVGGEISAGYEGMSIIIIDRATGTVTHTLLTGQFHFASLDWARQGSNKLAFHDSGGSGMIYTVDIDSGTAVPVVEGIWPSWSPDNSKIVYRQLGRKPKISTYEFSTGDITQLTNGRAPVDWRRF